MQLSYRGLNYELTAKSLPKTQNEVTARYRGTTYITQRLFETLPNPVYKLRYRGVSYYPGAHLGSREASDNTFKFQSHL